MLTGGEPLLRVSDRSVLGKAHVCYEADSGGVCWWPATVGRPAGQHAFTATFSIGPPASFAHAVDEAVAATEETTAFIQRNPRAAVVFTTDLRTGETAKWLYRDGHECLMAFCMAFNNHQNARGHPARILPAVEMRGKMLRNLGKEQDASSGLHVTYASQAPSTPLPPAAQGTLPVAV
jgi:hypothetical protein